MASDKAFRVSWPAGQITVHRADAKGAIEVALEYLRVPEAKRMVAEPLSEWEQEAVDAVRRSDA